jgi:hypothetical protein
MNTFGASDHFRSVEELDEVVKRCRDIASAVLGNMGEEERKKLCTFDKESGPDAKMWAIGHWYVPPRPTLMLKELVFTLLHSL